MSELSLAGHNLLVVEDDPLLGRQIRGQLERWEAEVWLATSLAQARQQLQGGAFDFALLDMNLPDGLGIELLREGAFPEATAVVVMTAQGSIANAVEAMRLGAADYLTKPFDAHELPLVLTRAARFRNSKRLAEPAKDRLQTTLNHFFFGSTLGELERKLRKILEADARVQSKLPPVLIVGETGTGKTTIARWLHHNGPRAAGPLVEVNCSALAESLAESELFGHERGAFTDAKTSRLGLFEAASGGTLFLDELPSLSVGLQAKILKVIEDHRIRRLGGSKEIEVDTRIIAATNVDLKAAVAGGQFREDLLHRLDLFQVQIPPLRARGDDLVPLAQRILTALCRKHRLPEKKLSPVGQQRLRACRWPGNVRELEHELERAVVFESGESLMLEQLQLPLAAVPAGAAPAWLNPEFTFPAEGFLLEEATGTLIRKALAQTGNNVSAAARMLGVSRDFLRYRLADAKAKPGDGE